MSQSPRISRFFALSVLVMLVIICGVAVSLIAGPTVLTELKRPNTQSDVNATQSGLTPEEVYRSIVPGFVSRKYTNVEELLENGSITKWTEPLRIKLIYDKIDAAAANDLIQRQGSRLLVEMSRVARLEIEFVSDISEANTIIFVAARSTSVPELIPYKELEAWFGVAASEFAVAQKKIHNEAVQCFRFSDSPQDRTVRGFGFVSLSIIQEDQETCLALNLLYILGMRGELSRESAGTVNGSARSLGMLDIEALSLIYNPRVQPGTKLRDVLNITNSQGASDLQ